MAPSAIDNPPALRDTGIEASSTTAVSLPSMMRWMRSHVARGMRDNPTAETSMRSSTTIVHTPDCTMRFSALMARSMVRSSSVPGPETPRTPGTHAGSTALAVFDSACPRTHNTCGRAMPAAAPASGSKRSKVSTSAVHSPRAVAAASAAQARLVRPDDCGPTISESCPRGIPPRSTWLMAAEGNGAIAGVCAGITEVSVRSSLRARNSDSNPAALAAGIGSEPMIGGVAPGVGGGRGMGGRPYAGLSVGSS